MAICTAFVLVLPLLADAGLPNQVPPSAPGLPTVTDPQKPDESTALAQPASPVETPASNVTAPNPATAAPASAFAPPETDDTAASGRNDATETPAIAARPPVAKAPSTDPLDAASEDADNQRLFLERNWFAWTGWILSLLLALYLIRAQSKWRTAFGNKEWLLLPSHAAHQLEDGLQQLAHRAAALTSRVDESATKNSKHVEGVSQAIHDTRSEFAILREELDRKTKEIADLRLGHEFHSRRSVLRAVAHALQIIEEDQACGRHLEATLDGVAVELRECLQDNNVAARRYEPGTRLSDAKGVSTQESIKEPAAEESLKGTIGETIRSAYVVVGPAGTEEVLRHARVRIFT